MDAADEVRGRAAEARGRDEHAARRLLVVEAAGEVAHAGDVDGVGALPALGLDVEAVETERVEQDHGIDAAVAGAAEADRGLVPPAAVAHGEKEVDHQAFEEGGAARHLGDGENTLDHGAAQRRVELVRRRGEALGGWSGREGRRHGRRRLRCWRLRRGRLRGWRLGGARLAGACRRRRELGNERGRAEVVAVGHVGEQRAAARGRPEGAARAALDEAGPQHVRPRPMGAMLEDGEAAARHGAGALRGGERELVRQAVHRQAQRGLALGRDAQQRQHELLIVGKVGRGVHPVSCLAITRYRGGMWNAPAAAARGGTPEFLKLGKEAGDNSGAQAVPLAPPLPACGERACPRLDRGSARPCAPGEGAPMRDRAHG